MTSERDRPAGLAPDEPGPIDAQAWPRALAAFLVDTRGAARVAGFALTDLTSVPLAALPVVALTREAPTLAQVQALAAATWLCAAHDVAHASVHATISSHVAGAPPRATVGVAAMGLAQEAAAAVEELRPLLAWLAAPGAAALPPPLSCPSHLKEAAAAVAARLCDAGVRLPPGAEDRAPEELLACAAFAAGLDDPAHLEVLLLWARLPAAVGEAFARAPGSFRELAVDTPPMTYAPPAREEDPP